MKRKTHSFFFSFATILFAAIFLFTMTGCPSSTNNNEGGKTVYADGVYIGEGSGIGGTVEVIVTIENGKIAKVEIGKHKESIYMPEVVKAFTDIPKAIVAAQSIKVDGVSGATITSNAIKEGVRRALEKAAGGGGGSESITLPFKKTDVIVVGAGLAGLTASVKALELGANVLVFEQTGLVGGNGNVAGGTLLAVNTIMQREAGITDDSVELLLQDIEKFGGKGNFDESLARTYGERSGAIVDWLDKTLKVIFANERTPGEGAYNVLNRSRVHILAPASGETSFEAGMALGATGLVKTLKEHLDKSIAAKKAYLATEFAVTELIIEGGKVVGVKARNRNGIVTSYRAPSVILATGGYGHNEALLKEYTFTNVATMVLPFVDGSGITMAKAAGAAFRNMDYCNSYGGAIPTNGFYPIGLFAPTGGVTGAMKEQIWVDKSGRRLANEATAHTKEKSDVWNAAQDNIVFIIISSAEVFKNVSPLSRQASAEAGWARLEELAAEGVHAFKGSTIEALADAAGINRAEFVSTINTYNNDAEAGKDSVFDRSTFMVPFDEGPFYAIRTIPFIMMTAGGVRASPKAEVLREDGNPIPGLYLAGEIIGSSNIAGFNSLGGTGNGNTVVWGYIAAESAVQNALGK